MIAALRRDQHARESALKQQESVLLLLRGGASAHPLSGVVNPSMALIKLIALAAVAPPAAPLVPRARRRAPLLRRASTQQGTLPPEESAPPDWEAMYLAGGDTSRESAPPQRPGPVIVGVSASPAAAAIEGWDACVDALQQLNIDARIEEALGDDDGWCRVGVDFQTDILEAHRRGMRCVFLKEKNDDVEDVPASSATPHSWCTAGSSATRRPL